MMKKLCVLLCSIVILVGCIFGVLCVIRQNEPVYQNGIDVHIAIKGNAYQIADVEAQLLDAVGKTEIKAENIKYNRSIYELETDGSGSVCYIFEFDRPGTVYSRIWEKLTSRNLTGTLELWVSLQDAELYHINYIYGPE